MFLKKENKTPSTQAVGKNVKQPGDWVYTGELCSVSHLVKQSHSSAGWFTKWQYKDHRGLCSLSYMSVIFTQTDVDADVSGPECAAVPLQLRRTRRRWWLLQYPRVGDSQICWTTR